MFKRLSFLFLLITAMLLLGCTQYVSDVPLELRPTALVGQATYYDQTKLEACKKDSSCWTKFLRCYKPKCVDVKATGTPAEWGECVNGCLTKGKTGDTTCTLIAGEDDEFPTLAAQGSDSVCIDQGYDYCISSFLLIEVQEKPHVTFPVGCDGVSAAIDDLAAIKAKINTYEGYQTDDAAMFINCCKSE